MIKLKFTSLLFASLILLLSCSSNKKSSATATEDSATTEIAQEKTQQDEVQEQEGFKTTDKVGTTLIATVAEIIQPIKKEGSKSVCDKVPCTAYLRVDRLVEVGRFFDYSFGEEDKIGAYFTFSLAPTSKDLFPNIEVSYPGLKVGNKIKAYILVQSPVEAFPYTVDHYEIIP